MVDVVSSIISPSIIVSSTIMVSSIMVSSTIIVSAGGVTTSAGVSTTGASAGSSAQPTNARAAIRGRNFFIAGCARRRWGEQDGPERYGPAQPSRRTGAQRAK